MSLETDRPSEAPGETAAQVNAWLQPFWDLEQKLLLSCALTPDAGKLC